MQRCFGLKYDRQGSVLQAVKKQTIFAFKEH